MKTKGKRGKTKGATSFLTVSLRELNTVLRPEASVIISRRYAETLGLKGVVEKRNDKETIDSHAKPIEFETSEETIDVKVKDF